MCMCIYIYIHMQICNRAAPIARHAGPPPLRFAAPSTYLCPSRRSAVRFAPPPLARDGSTGMAVHGARRAATCADAGCVLVRRAMEIGMDDEWRDAGGRAVRARDSDSEECARRGGRGGPTPSSVCMRPQACRSSKEVRVVLGTPAQCSILTCIRTIY